MEYSDKYGGVYYTQGASRMPLLVGLHGYGMWPGDEWWRWLSYPRRSGLLTEVLARKWSAIFISAGRTRNWKITDGPRVADAASAFRLRFGSSRTVGMSHSDGVLGQLSADATLPTLFSALVCVGGVYEPEVEVKAGCPVWFTCGEHDVPGVARSLQPLVDAYQDAGRFVRGTVIPNARHGWPTEYNSSFFDWSSSI